MIVPMKKVFLVVQENGLKDTLKKLRKFGLVHLEQLDGASEKLDTLKSDLSQIQLAYSMLSEQKAAKGSVKDVDTLSMDKAVEVAKDVVNLSERKKTCFAQITADTVELERYSAWGEFVPSDFAYLKEKGIPLTLYEIPSDKYGLIDKDTRTLLVSKDKSQARFLLLDEVESGVHPAGLPPEAYQISLPAMSTKELSERIKENKAEITKIEETLLSDRCYVPALKKTLDTYEKEIEFENIYSGMGKDVASEESAVPLGALAWVTGYIPTSDLPALQNEAKAQNWALMADDPAEDDENVPTKLKNNKLVGLIYPVSDFLGTVPGYHEYDISNWFLLFFTILFAMIFGDAGYGILLTAIAVLGILSAVSKKKSPAPVMKLLLLIGVTTIVWGTLTCTWFGLRPEQLPDSIKGLSLAAISNVSSAKEGFVLGYSFDLSYELWVKENLQIFCFSLALVQLSIAHLKGIARYHKSVRCLGELGSMLMLWGMYYVVLSMVVDGNRFPLGADGAMIVPGINVPLPTLCIGLIGFGFFLSFVFSNYSGSVVKSILESCKNIVSVLLGVVNVFSDIVSYIRLWAVALAGSAISDTVNTMAGPMLGKLIFFLGILLLVFGHGLNMILNVLSVIVHGVRLNTLEFSTHLGMSWSGFKYKPFSEQ